MRRHEILRRLAEEATFPIDPGANASMHQPAEPPVVRTIEKMVEQKTVDAPLQSIDAAPASASTDIFVWFEDTSARCSKGRRGIAGLPECLLPYARGVRVLERKYTEGHHHLLTAARIRCDERFGERIAAIYTTALAVGTIAWIGTGERYAQAWREIYPEV